MGLRIAENFSFHRGTAPQTINNTTITGTGIDISGALAGCVVATFGTLPSGAVATVTLEHSDVVGSGYTPVAGAVLSPTAVTDAQKTFLMDFKPERLKKFIRVISANSHASNAQFGVEVILEPKHKPATAPAGSIGLHTVA